MDRFEFIGKPLSDSLEFIPAVVVKFSAKVEKPKIAEIREETKETKELHGP